MAKGFSEPRYKALVEKLVAQRKRLGLRQQDLADRLGHHQQFVSRFETGERRLDAIEYADVCKALDVDPCELLIQAAKI